MIVVLTKVDALESPACSQLIDEGCTMKEAKPRVREIAEQLLSGLRTRIESQLSGFKYPPKAYLPMACKSSRSILHYVYFGLNILMQVWTRRVLIVVHS